MSATNPRRTWPDFANDIYDPGLKLRIDGLVGRMMEEGRLQPTITSIGEAIRRGRRTLEIAITSAADEEANYSPGVAIDEWRAIHEGARKARIALEGLVAAMGPRGQKIERPEDICRALSLAKVHSEARLGAVDAPDERASWAREKALDLLSAIGAVSLLEEEADALRRSISASNQNPGDPGRRVFVFRLVEGWIWLTGSVPSSYSGGRPGESQFLQFLSSAWEDAGQPFSDKFDRSVRSATQQAKGLGPHKLAAIAAHGPDWK